MSYLQTIILGSYIALYCMLCIQKLETIMLFQLKELENVLCCLTK